MSTADFTARQKIRIAGDRSISPRTQVRTVSLCLMAIVAAAGCGILAWWGIERDPKSGLIFAMAALASAPFAIRGLQGRWDPFEPIQLIALMMLFWFVARPIMELREHLEQYAAYGQYDSLAGFKPAMVVGLVGTAALYVGYFSGAGIRLAGRLRSLPNEWDGDRSVRYTIGLLGVGFVLSLFFLAQIGLAGFLSIYTGRGVNNLGVFHSSSGYFQYGPYVAIPGSLIALSAWQKRRSLGAGLVLALCLGISLFLTVRRGDRTFTLGLILPLILLPYLHRHRRPRLVTIAVALVVFTIFSNVSAKLRDLPHPPATPVLVNAISHPLRQAVAFVRSPDGSEFSVLEIEMRRYQQRQLPLWPGSTLVSLLTGWIPHQFFPGGGKPESPLQHVTWTMFPSTTGGGSFGPPMYGSFYADDGWLSLILISAAVGLGLRVLWEYFRRHSESPGTQMFFAMTLPLAAMLARADLSLMFAAGVFLALPIVLCIRRCSRVPLNLSLRRRRHAPA